MKLMIIAGEVSGDMHAGALLAEIRKIRPDVEAFGIGGPHLRSAGMETVHDIKDTAVVGFTEVLRRCAFFARLMREMVELAGRRRPDAVVLVDYPGFNLRFARRAHALGFKVIYYICPQVWAWHRSRIPKMARIVDRLITIFPFEPPLFEGTGLKTSFVGHPLVEEVAGESGQPADLEWEGTPRIALLPGSRPSEVKRILPVLWKTAVRVEAAHPQAGFAVATPSAAMTDLASRMLDELGGGPKKWRIIEGMTRSVLRSAKAAVVASGTATLEAALAGCPMAVVYRTSPLTHALARLLVHVKDIGMVNIIAGKRICPEFVQDDARPENIADSLIPLLAEGEPRRIVLDGLRKVVEALGGRGAGRRAAEIVLEELAVKSGL